jgi:ribosomal protein S18 acetylase RimI-like enzyme
MRPQDELTALEIRMFRDADRAGVIALWDEAFPDDPAHNVSAAMIERKLQVQPELFLVALADGELVGTVMAGYDGVRGWLHRLAVRTSQRRARVGTELVRRAEAELAKLGCPKVNLQVRSTNAAVIGFYRAIGYATDDNVSLGKRLVGRGARHRELEQRLALPGRRG